MRSRGASWRNRLLNPLIITATATGHIRPLPSHPRSSLEAGLRTGWGPGRSPSVPSSLSPRFLPRQPSGAVDRATAGGLGRSWVPVPFPLLSAGPANGGRGAPQVMAHDPGTLDRFMETLEHLAWMGRAGQSPSEKRFGLKLPQSFAGPVARRARSPAPRWRVYTGVRQCQVCGFLHPHALWPTRPPVSH